MPKSERQGNLLFRRNLKKKQLLPIKSVFKLRNGSTDILFIARWAPNDTCPWEKVPKDIKLMFFSDTFGIPRPPPVHFRPAAAIEKEPNASIPNGGRPV